MERKFFRVTGLSRMMILLGFSIAGVNRHIIKSFRDKNGSGTTTTAGKKRSKRREATRNNLLGSSWTTSGSDPPAA